MSQYDFHVCDVATNVKLWNGHLVNRVRPYPTECDTSIWAPRPKLCGRCGVCGVPWHLQNCPRDRGRERIWNAMKCLYFKILWAPLPTYNKCMIYIQNISKYSCTFWVCWTASFQAEYHEVSCHEDQCALKKRHQISTKVSFLETLGTAFQTGAAKRHVNHTVNCATCLNEKSHAFESLHPKDLESVTNQQ